MTTKLDAETIIDNIHMNAAYNLELNEDWIVSPDDVIGAAKGYIEQCLSCIIRDVCQLDDDGIDEVN